MFDFLKQWSVLVLYVIFRTVTLMFWVNLMNDGMLWTFADAFIRDVAVAAVAEIASVDPLLAIFMLDFLINNKSLIKNEI